MENSSETRIGPQSFGTINCFPAETFLITAERSEGRGLPVARTAQVQRLDDPFWSEMKIGADNFGKPLFVYLRCAKAIDVNRHGFGNADCIGKLHFTLVSDTCSHDVLRDIARHIAG